MPLRRSKTHLHPRPKASAILSVTTLKFSPLWTWKGDWRWTFVTICLQKSMIRTSWRKVEEDSLSPNLRETREQIWKVSSKSKSMEADRDLLLLESRRKKWRILTIVTSFTVDVHGVLVFLEVIESEIQSSLENVAQLSFRSSLR